MQRVGKGDRVTITASDWNAFIDAAQDYQRRQGFAAEVEGVQQPGIVVTVKNTTAGTVPRFGILRISDILIDPADNAPLFKDRFPLKGAAPTGAGIFVVTLEPLATGKIGQAIVAGAVPCVVNVTSSGHGYAVSASGDVDKLVSSSTAVAGAVPILWKASGTGNLNAVVLLPTSLAAASSGGITSLGSQTGATQTFSTGTSGSDVNWSSSGDVHTLNLPDAGTSARGAVTTGTQTIAGAKTFTAAVNVGGLHITNVSGSNTNIAIDLPGSGSAVGSITIGATTDGITSGVGTIFCEESNVNDITGFLVYDTGDDATCNGLLTGRYYNEGGSIYGYKDSRYAVTVLDTGVKYGATGTLVDGSEVYGGIVCTIGASLTYTASTNTDWAASTPPTNVATALDRLAAACTAAGFPP